MFIWSDTHLGLVWADNGIRGPCTINHYQLSDMGPYWALQKSISNCLLLWCGDPKALCSQSKAQTQPDGGRGRKEKEHDVPWTLAIAAVLQATWNNVPARQHTCLRASKVKQLSACRNQLEADTASLAHTHALCTREQEPHQQGCGRMMGRVI